MLDQVKEILENQSKNRGNFKLKTLPHPTLLPGLEDAAKKIVEFLKEGKRGLIVGDYDCDGIIGTTVTYDIFMALGFKSQIEYIVPDRFVDGYGVSNNMVNYAIENMFDFIITVDNGIGAVAPIDYARDNGIYVILTDHHTPGTVIPNADIIVNPKYDLGDFPFMEISGATVAWYLCCQINTELNAGLNMIDWLDLVGITVISDVMPLESVNIPLVHYALKQMKLGKRYLFNLVFDINKRVTLTETDVAFGLVPMINAVGRLDHAKQAIDVLLSKDKGVIMKGYKYFVDINNKRKYLNEELLKRVLPEAEKQASLGVNAIVVREADLHEGIIGILAGKLAERFMRPAYVFGFNEKKNIWKGSGRSSGIVQLYDLTAKAKEHALGFGGHAGAVGVAIEKDNFEKWKELIVKGAEHFTYDDFKPVGADAITCNFNAINNELINLLNEYRPFGEGFPAPIFRTKVYIKTLNSYKEGLHWKCALIDEEGNSMEGFFFHEKRISELDESNIYITYTPTEALTHKGRAIEIHASIAE